jgi:hypothetical protein
MRVFPNNPRRRLRLRGKPRRAFTLLELQIAVILLAFGLATMASLMATQHRLLKRIEGDFQPDSTLCLTRSIDPWVKKLNTPARITLSPITQTPPTAVTVANDVTIVSQVNGMTDQTIVVTADVTEVP